MPSFVITGASQGIGAAIATTTASRVEGAHLHLLARNQENLQKVAVECQQLGATTTVFSADLTIPEQVKAAATMILDEHGAPDVLVNNAGAFTPGSILDTSVGSFQKQVAVNLTSAFMVTQAFLPAMLAAGSGHLFFMASVASIRAYAGGAAYCAAKHGLLGLARVVREETKDQGLRVTTLMPGATLTPSWDGVDVEPERLMPAEDIAQVLLDVWSLSGRSVVEELVVRPQLGDL